MSDYEYTMLDRLLFSGRMARAIKADLAQIAARKRKPPLTVEVTHRYVTFIRPHTSTSYEPSRSSYDMLAALANSGEYDVEILDSGYGVAWQMRRKEMNP